MDTTNEGHDDLSKFLEPIVVKTALEHMNAGDASGEVLAVIVAAAESYAQMSVEWGFDSPMTGMAFATRNDMLVQTMAAAKPSARILYRVAPDWEEVPA